MSQYRLSLVVSVLLTMIGTDSAFAQSNCNWSDSAVRQSYNAISEAYQWFAADIERRSSVVNSCEQLYELAGVSVEYGATAQRYSEYFVGLLASHCPDMQREYLSALERRRSSSTMKRQQALGKKVVSLGCP